MFAELYYRAPYPLSEIDRAAQSIANEPPEVANSRQLSLREVAKTRAWGLASAVGLTAAALVELKTGAHWYAGTAAAVGLLAMPYAAINYAAARLDLEQAENNWLNRLEPTPEAPTIEGWG